MVRAIPRQRASNLPVYQHSNLQAQGAAKLLEHCIRRVHVKGREALGPLHVHTVQVPARLASQRWPPTLRRALDCWKAGSKARPKSGTVLAHHRLHAGAAPPNKSRTRADASRKWHWMEVGNRHPPPGSGCSLSAGALAALNTRCSALLQPCRQRAMQLPPRRGRLPPCPLAYAHGPRPRAGAETAPPPAPAGVRLAGGLSPTTGRLEVLVNGTTWATVCRWAAAVADTS